MFLSPKFLYDNAAADTAGGSEVDKAKVEDAKSKIAAQLGQQPLQPETTTPSKTTNEAGEEITDTRTPEQITADKIEEEAQKLVLSRAAEIENERLAEQERLRLEQAGENVEPVVKITKIKVAEAKVETPETTEDDINNEKLLAQLSKTLGRQINSLDELTPTHTDTPEEKEAKHIKRESAKMEFGLKAKKVTKEQIEDYIKDTNNPEAVAFEVYASNLKEVSPELTDKQIRERFEERYSINEDEETVEYKAGQKELNFIATRKIAEKHSAYLNLENQYSAFEQSELTEQTRKKSILQKAPQFKKDIELVTDKLKKFKIAGYDVELGDDILGAYKDEVFASEYSEKIIESGYDLNKLEKSFKNHVIEENLDAIVIGILEADRLKNQAGTRGVITTKTKNPAQDVSENKKNVEDAIRKQLGVGQNN